MIRRERCIVIDIDGTLCGKRQPDESYDDIPVNTAILATLRSYRDDGFYVILATSRNMNTYDGNVGLITANTVRNLLGWLDKNGVPYDELHVGKPWAGKGGFYVDDKTIRPDEFRRLTYNEILAIVGND